MAEQNRKMLLWAILIGLILGGIIGAIFAFIPEEHASKRYALLVAAPLGDLFIRLLKMIVTPVIIFTLISGVASISPARLGKVGVKIIVFYMLTSFLAIIVGLAVGNIMQPGEGVTLKETTQEIQAKEAPSLVETLLAIVPTNPFESIAKGDVLPIIFFSIFFKTKRVSLIRDFLYNYRINRNGSIVQKGGRQFMDIIDVVELMYNSIKDLPVFNEIKNEFYIRKADDIVYRYELIDFWQKRKFSKKLREKKFLFDLEIFDFDYIKNKAPYTYNNIFGIKDKSNIIKYKFNKFQRKFMLKIMQILYTEDGIYYLKYRKLVLRLKKRAWLCDIWYEKDRIYFIIFSFIKFSFKFGYSKLEKSFK